MVLWLFLRFTVKIRLSKAISWVGPEKKGVSKIFFLTFLTSYKHSMAKKSDRTHHSFSDPTLTRPSKDPIWSLREHKIGEHKSKVFQRSSRGIQDSREYVPPRIWHVGTPPQAVFFPANPSTLFAGNYQSHRKSNEIWTKLIWSQKSFVLKKKIGLIFCPFWEFVPILFH